MPRFVQTSEPVPNGYAGDPVLRSTLERLLGDVGHKDAAPLLERLAAEVGGPLDVAATDAERHPPQLEQYDAWGARVDRIRTSAGWETLRQAAARHGLVALPYEDVARATWGSGARVVQLALIHLYAPGSATYSCPVAMSDGAATVLLADGVDRGLRDRLVPRLLSRDPATAWTSGQWMTETEGGSDVGRATTRAERDDAGDWRLTGEKWFCSSTTSEIAVALARPADATAGSRGLATFVVPRYDDAETVTECSQRRTAAGVVVHRLKDKLGTRALPSAEVGLEGALAWPVGDPSEPGLKRMLGLVQITRLHNTACAAAGMRRGLLMARTYAQSREVFGAPLHQQPLHRETLAWLAVDADAAFALGALCFDLLGRLEVDQDQGSGRLLRLAATLAKASTGRLAVAAASEYVEAFGGPGYIEDTGVPRLLRDSQVLPIWEGTTNVLSLDVLRALTRDDARTDYLRRVDRSLDAAAAALPHVVDLLRPVRDRVAEDARAAAASAAAPSAQAAARSLMTRMAHLLAAIALLEQATWEAERGNPRGALVTELWTRRRLLGDDCAGEGHAAFDSVVDHR